MLGPIRRLLRAPARGGDEPSPQEVITYEGRVHLEPADEFGDGNVILVGEGNLVDHLYNQLPVPSTDDRMHVNVYARITFEVLPDPDLHWWP